MKHYSINHKQNYKVIVIIFFSFVFSLRSTNMIGQEKIQIRYKTTIKASSPLDLLYKMQKKNFLLKKPGIMKKPRLKFSDDISKIFSSDTIYLIGFLDDETCSYEELIWSREDSIQYYCQYQFGVFDLKRNSNFWMTEMLPVIRSNVPLYCLKPVKRYWASILIYRIYRKGENKYNIIIDVTDYDDEKERLVT